MTDRLNDTFTDVTEKVNDTAHRYRQPKYYLTEVTDTLKDSIFKKFDL